MKETFKSKFLLSLVCLLFLLLLQGCGGHKDIDIAGKTYCYIGEPFSDMEGDEFTISISKDGTFTYYESMFSSYLGIGEWTVNHDILTLKDDSQVGFSLQNSFRIDGDDLIFIENGSDNFTYIKVKDGERFEKVVDTEMLSAPDETEM